MPVKKNVTHYRCVQAFGVQYEGEQITVPAGEIVRAGHPLLKRRENLFVPVESFGRFDVDVEQATTAPRGANRAK